MAFFRPLTDWMAHAGYVARRGVGRRAARLALFALYPRFGKAKFGQPEIKGGVFPPIAA